MEEEKNIRFADFLLKVDLAHFRPEILVDFLPKVSTHSVCVFYHVLNNKMAKIVLHRITGGFRNHFYFTVQCTVTDSYLKTE